MTGLKQCQSRLNYITIWSFVGVLSLRWSWAITQGGDLHADGPGLGWPGGPSSADSCPVSRLPGLPDQSWGRHWPTHHQPPEAGGGAPSWSPLLPSRHSHWNNNMPVNSQTKALDKQINRQTDQHLHKLTVVMNVVYIICTCEKHVSVWEHICRFYISLTHGWNGWVLLPPFQSRQIIGMCQSKKPKKNFKKKFQSSTYNTYEKHLKVWVCIWVFFIASPYRHHSWME